MKAFERRAAAEERTRRRMASAFDDTTTPPAEPLDMAEHGALFREAREAYLASAFSGEVPERLRHHAAVNEAVNEYAAGLHKARPGAFRDADDAVWAARGKRDELIQEHQYTAGTPADVLETVADRLRETARTLTRPTPAPVAPAAPTARTQAAESTPRRKIVRIREIGTITKYPDFHPGYPASR